MDVPNWIWGGMVFAIAIVLMPLVGLIPRNTPDVSSFGEPDADRRQRGRTEGK